MKLIFRSSFLLVFIIVLGALILTIISFDRTKSDSVVIIGHLSEAQLFSVRDRLRKLEGDPTKKMIREALINLTWVQAVNVRRQWPNGVSIEILAETAVAYWNDNGFINPKGKVLVTELLAVGDLPGLYGPDGTEQEVMARYQELGGILAGHGLEIRNLRRSDLGSWTIETSDRVMILLGDEDLKPRIERFLAVNSQLKRSDAGKRVKRMDARYINGVAVQFEEKLNLSSASGEARNDINENLEVRSL